MGVNVTEMSLQDIFEYKINNKINIKTFLSLYQLNYS